jgi:hypothetical protein
MKKLVAFSCFVFGLLGLKAQSHPFYAGQTDSVIYTEYVDYTSNTYAWYTNLNAGGV